LDIDKIERFPISFVIKSNENTETLRKKLEEGARKQFGVEKVVFTYMACIEEIINIPILRERFLKATEQGHLPEILQEIVKQSRVEFNYADEENVSDEDDDLDEMITSE
jgi:cell division protein FtsL